MKVSGKIVAEAILKKLEEKIKKENIKPKLAIILAGDDPSSRIYVNNKIKAAEQVGVVAKLYEFSQNEKAEVLKRICKLNEDSSVDGIIVQYPVYEGWDFEEFEAAVDPQKDVDGFRADSPYSGATALGVWEMLTAFALLEGYKKTEDFLRNKEIVVLGRGKAAGGPITKLLEEKSFEVTSIVKGTENPTPKIKSGDIVISATGVKNIVNKTNLKKGSYVVGVGVGKEIVNGKPKIFGDIKEDEVSQVAKLYCPTIGGIGPLTIVSLLENVVKSAEKKKKVRD